jgi:hypothetical protein
MQDTIFQSTTSSRKTWLYFMTPTTALSPSCWRILSFLSTLDRDLVAIAALPLILTFYLSARCFCIERLLPASALSSPCIDRKFQIQTSVDLFLHVFTLIMFTSSYVRLDGGLLLNPNLCDLTLFRLRFSASSFFPVLSRGQQQGCTNIDLYDMSQVHIALDIIKTHNEKAN